jgi:hypothetical protein
MNKLDMLLEGPPALVRLVQALPPKQRCMALGRIKRLRKDLDIERGFTRFRIDYKGQRLYTGGHSGSLTDV